MAKNKYQAIGPNGEIFKRSTDREYVAAVIAQRSYEKEMAWAEKPAKVDGKNWEYHCQMVAWGGLYQGKRQAWDTDEQIAKTLAKSQKLAGEYESAAAAIEGERLKRVARVEEAKAAGAFETWHLVGFCGRMDLAQKLAASSIGPKKVYGVAKIIPAELA